VCSREPRQLKGKAGHLRLERNNEEKKRKEQKKRDERKGKEEKTGR